MAISPGLVNVTMRRAFHDGGSVPVTSTRASPSWQKGPLMPIDAPAFDAIASHSAQSRPRLGAVRPSIGASTSGAAGADRA